jgi:Fe-S-cluster containining protein
MTTYALDLRTAYGYLRHELEVPDGEIDLAAFARLALPVGQKLVDLMEAVYLKAGRPASCKVGCAACCRQEIPISAPEALLLSAHAATLPGPERERIAAGFAAIRSHVQATGSGGKDLERGTATADVRAQGLAWFRQGLACPFLVDESCSAYAMRPVACRNHMVWSAAEQCSRPEDGGVKAMNVRFSLSTILALLAAEFMEREPTKFPLAALEDWVRLNPEYQERTFPAEKLAERFIELLGEFARRTIPIPASMRAPREADPKR